MTKRSAWYAILACSTALAGTPALAQAAPGPQQLPNAQPGTIAGSAQGDETATDTSAERATSLDQQSAAPPAKGVVPVDNGADIVVTAQRTETKLSRTPVAVAVLRGDTLAKANIRTEQDLQLATPGLTVRAGSSSQQLNYALRGQSLDAFSFGRPGVLPYFDEVQVSTPTGSSSIFYDLQSVQVLKGPQGTLFGRNSTGGAVLFTTTRPSYDFGGFASVLGGNYGTYRGEGAVNVPIVENKVAIRAAGYYSTTNGFQRNTVDGKRRGDAKRFGVRGSLRMDLGSIHNYLTVDYQHAKGTSLVGNLGNIDALPGSFPTLALYDPATSDFVLGLVLQGLGLPPGAATAIATGNFDRYLALQPEANRAGLAAEFAAQQSRGPFVVNSDVSDFFSNNNLLVSNVTTFDLGENVQLKNVLGYVNIKSQQIPNVDGSAFGITQSIGDGIVNKANSFSEELQILGSTGPLKYVAGLYYSAEKANNRQRSLLFDIIPFGLLTGNPAVIGIDRRNDFISRNTTYAGYAQGTYDLSDTIIPGLSVTGGARYTSEKVRGTIQPTDAFFGLATTGLLAGDGSVILPASEFSNDQSQTFNNVSWTVSINEKLNPHLLIYAASRRSYKNGGFNGIIQPRIGFADAAVSPGNAYRRETVTDGELGLKFNGKLGTMPTTLNLAGYYDAVRNSQRTAFISQNGQPAAITVNVPKARIYGFEVDGSIDPARYLRIGGTLNYTNAKFTDNLVALAGQTVPFGTYPDTPKYSGGAYADVTIPTTHALDMLLHGDVYAQSKSFFSSAANLNPGAVLPSYTIVNFRVGVQDSVRGLSLTANLKNAFDKVYFVGGLPVAPLTQINTILPGAPRTFTLEARMKF